MGSSDLDSLITTDSYCVRPSYRAGLFPSIFGSLQKHLHGDTEWVVRGGTREKLRISDCVSQREFFQEPDASVS
jgi:hypothetical protein